MEKGEGITCIPPWRKGIVSQVYPMGRGEGVTGIPPSGEGGGRYNRYTT